MRLRLKHTWVSLSWSKVQAFVLSRLDYGNSVLAGAPVYNAYKTQLRASYFCSSAWPCDPSPASTAQVAGTPAHQAPIKLREFVWISDTPLRFETRATLRGLRLKIDAKFKTPLPTKLGKGWAKCLESIFYVQSMDPTSGILLTGRLGGCLAVWEIIGPVKIQHHRLCRLRRGRPWRTDRVPTCTHLAALTRSDTIMDTGSFVAAYLTVTEWKRNRTVRHRSLTVTALRLHLTRTHTQIQLVIRHDSGNRQRSALGNGISVSRMARVLKGSHLHTPPNKHPLTEWTTCLYLPFAKFAIREQKLTAFKTHNCRPTVACFANYRHFMLPFSSKISHL